MITTAKMELDEKINDFKAYLNMAVAAGTLEDLVLVSCLTRCRS